MSKKRMKNLCHKMELKNTHLQHRNSNPSLIETKTSFYTKIHHF